MIKVLKLKSLKSRYSVSFLQNDQETKEVIVSEDLVVEYRLLEGKDLTEAQYAAFLKDQAIDEVFQKAIRFALKFHKSTMEVKNYLSKNAISSAEEDRIIAKLKKLKILDDESLINNLFENYFHIKKQGPLKMDFLFRQKGFDDALIKSVLSQIRPAQIDDNLLTLFQRKCSSLKHQSFQKAKNTMISFLHQSGYELDMVQSFVIHHLDLLKPYINEEKEILEEIHKLNKKLSISELTPYEKSQKIIAHLMSKGYPYKEIKKALERGTTDER